MIKIKSAEFITSAVKKNQYPQTGFPEVSFVGRSNVGKSTIINALTNRRKLAKVSNTPGRTRLVKLFLINEADMIVAWPGYGYAKISKTAHAAWGKIIAFLCWAIYSLSTAGENTALINRQRLNSLVK